MRKTPPKLNPPPVQPGLKNTSLRLPPKLSDLAQQCADASGLSMNGLICSALADYLASRGYKVHSR